MLILTRCIGESVQIGDAIMVRVISIDGERVKLGFEAPDSVRIVRSELLGPDEPKLRPRERNS